jgi:hypothetical protein
MELSNLKVFSVYCDSKIVRDLKIKDIHKVIFIKNGLGWSYLLPPFNIVVALKKGFVLLAILLAICNLMMSVITSKLPFFYWVFCNFCFSFFIINISSDIEDFFAKRSKKVLITQIYAKNLNEAKIKFFEHFYPQYIQYLYSQKFKIDSSYYYPDYYSDKNNKKQSLVFVVLSKINFFVNLFFKRIQSKNK